MPLGVVIGILGLFLLALFLFGFYLGFSETYGMTPSSGIRFSGDGINHLRHRAYLYGLVVLGLVGIGLLRAWRPKSEGIIVVGGILLLLVPEFVLFFSTPSALIGNGLMSESFLNLVLFLDISTFPFLLILLFWFVYSLNANRISDPAR